MSALHNIFATQSIFSNVNERSNAIHGRVQYSLSDSNSICMDIRSSSSLSSSSSSSLMDSRLDQSSSLFQPMVESKSTSSSSAVTCSSSSAIAGSASIPMDYEMIRNILPSAEIPFNPSHSFTHFFFRTYRISEIINCVDFFKNAEYMTWNITKHLLWSTLNLSNANTVCLYLMLFSSFFTEYKVSDDPSKIPLTIDLKTNELLVHLNQLLKANVHEMIMYTYYLDKYGKEIPAPYRGTVEEKAFLIIQGKNPNGLGEKFPIPIYGLDLKDRKDAKKSAIQPDFRSKIPSYRFTHDIPCTLFNIFFSKRCLSKFTTLEYDPVHHTIYVAERSNTSYCGGIRYEIIGPTNPVTEQDIVVYARPQLPYPYTYSSSASLLSSSTASMISSSSSASLISSSLLGSSSLPSIPPRAPSVSVHSSSLQTLMRIQPRNLTRKKPDQMNLPKTRKQKLSSFVRVFIEDNQPLIFQYLMDHTTEPDPVQSRVEIWISPRYDDGRSPRISQLLGDISQYPSLQWTEQTSIQLWSTLSPLYCERMMYLQWMTWILLARDANRLNWLFKKSKKHLYMLFSNMICFYAPRSASPLIQTSWFQSFLQGPYSFSEHENQSSFSLLNHDEEDHENEEDNEEFEAEDEEEDDDDDVEEEGNEKRKRNSSATTALAEEDKTDEYQVYRKKEKKSKTKRKNGMKKNKEKGSYKKQRSKKRSKIE